MDGDVVPAEVVLDAELVGLPGIELGAALAEVRDAVDDTEPAPVADGFPEVVPPPERRTATMTAAAMTTTTAAIATHGQRPRPPHGRDIRVTP